MRIGLSTSFTNHPHLGNSHVTVATQELARALLRQGHTVVYGGDLRQAGLTWALVTMARAYTPGADLHGAIRERLINVLAWPIFEGLSYAERVELEQALTVVQAPLPLGEQAKYQPLCDEKVRKQPEQRESWSKCLTAMREELVRRTDGRVLLGGQLSGYEGMLPGILEEAASAVKNRQRLFLIRSYGGISASIAKLVGSGDVPEALDRARHWEYVKGQLGAGADRHQAAHHAAFDEALETLRTTPADLIDSEPGEDRGTPPSPHELARLVVEWAGEQA